MGKYNLLMAITAIWSSFIVVTLMGFTIPFGILWIPFLSAIFFVRPIYWLIGDFSNSTFKCVLKDNSYEVHMSIYANISMLDKGKVKNFKKGLLDCMVQRVKEGGKTVTMRSHILSPNRVKEISEGLKQAFPFADFDVKTKQVKTTRFESIMLRAHFLVVEWRFVEVRPSSLQATFTKIDKSENPL